MTIEPITPPTLDPQKKEKNWFQSNIIALIALAISIINLANSLGLFNSFHPHPTLLFNTYNKKRNDELFVTIFSIKNTGNSPAKDIEGKFTIFYGSQYDKDTDKYIWSEYNGPDKITTVTFRRKDLVPGDSISLAIETNYQDYKNYKQSLAADKGDLNCKIVPSIVYFKTMNELYPCYPSTYYSVTE